MIVSGGGQLEDDEMGFSAGGTNNDEEDGAAIDTTPANNRGVIEMTPPTIYSPRNQNDQLAAGAPSMFH